MCFNSFMVLGNGNILITLYICCCSGSSVLYIGSFNIAFILMQSSQPKYSLIFKQFSFSNTHHIYSIITYFFEYIFTRNIFIVNFLSIFIIYHYKNIGLFLEQLMYMFFNLFHITICFITTNKVINILNKKQFN